MAKLFYYFNYVCRMCVATSNDRLRIFCENRVTFTTEQAKLLKDVIKYLDPHATVDVYFVVELRNCRKEVMFASTADTLEKAKSLIWHLIPHNIVPLISKQHESDSTFQVGGVQQA